MMKILVTGASGLLGGKIAETSHRKHEMYSGFNKHRASHGSPMLLDITNETHVENAFKISEPEVVIHCAAVTNVDLCERDPELAQQVNIEGTRNLVKQAERVGAYLVYVSTDYVFDGKIGNYKETDTPSPINVYGATKLEAEKIVKNSKLDYCIARTCVVYGAKPAAGKTNFALWALNSLKENKTVNIVTDQIISPTYNQNLAEMIVEVSEKRLKGIFHLAGATYIDRFSYVKELAREFDLDEALIQPVTSVDMNWVAQRPLNSTLNTEKASIILNTKPMELLTALKMLHIEIHNQ